MFNVEKQRRGRKLKFGHVSASGDNVKCEKSDSENEPRVLCVSMSVLSAKPCAMGPAVVS